LKRRALFFRRVAWLAFAAGVLVAFLCQGWAWAQEPLAVRLATQNLCPLGCWNDRHEFRGTFVDVVRDALDSMHVGLELQVVPWGRAQRMARAGEVHGFFPAFRTPERDRMGVMSEGLTTNTWAWYLAKDSGFDPASSAFGNVARIGAVRSGVMADWLERNGYKTAGQPADVVALVDMLLAGRLDAVLDTREAVDTILAKRGLEDRLTRVEMMQSPVGVYFSHRFLGDNPGFMEHFNAAVHEIRNGR